MGGDTPIWLTGGALIWPMGGTPIQLMGEPHLAHKVGCPHLSNRGYPHLADGDTPCWDWMGVPPPLGLDGGYYLSRLDGVPPFPPSGDRAAERALAARRAVYLLRLRRRTFLVFFMNVESWHYLHIRNLCAFKNGQHIFFKK